MATEHYGRALLAFWGYSIAKRTAESRTHQTVISRAEGGIRDRRKFQKELRKQGVRLSLKEIKELTKTSGKAIRSQRETKIRSISEAIPSLKTSPRWNSSWETEEYQIAGKIDSGDRTETRTLREIYGDSGRWGRIAYAFRAGTLTATQAGDWFIDDVLFEQYSFSIFDLPGTSYSCHSTQPMRNW